MTAAGQIFWFTGLSGAGKSTLCERVRGQIEALGYRVLVLDGDDVRRRVHRHLGFSPEDIRENNALIADLCARHRGDCDVILVPIISPFHDSREHARQKLGDGFYTVYCSAGLDVVSARDVKGIYGRSRRKEITGVIGISPDVPYEPPERPDLTLDTGRQSVDASARSLLAFILQVLSRHPQSSDAEVQAQRNVAVREEP